MRRGFLLSLVEDTIRLRRYSWAMNASSESFLFRSKRWSFWLTFVTIFLADFVTKRWAERHLAPMYTPHKVVGDVVRMTLAFNKDAAMGLTLGAYSRVGFTLIAVIVLIGLGIFYRRIPASATVHATGLGLIAAGALGNLADRVLFSHGVVDFIDVGIGSSRFYTFNVADASITCGAVLLAILSQSGPARSAT